MLYHKESVMLLEIPHGIRNLALAGRIKLIGFVFQSISITITHGFI